MVGIRENTTVTQVRVITFRSALWCWHLARHQHFLTGSGGLAVIFHVWERFARTNRNNNQSLCVCLWQQQTTTGTNAISGETPAFLTKTDERENARRRSLMHTHTVYTCTKHTEVLVMRLDTGRLVSNERRKEMPSLKLLQVTWLGQARVTRSIFFLPRWELSFLPIRCRTNVRHVKGNTQLHRGNETFYTRFEFSG